MYKISISPEEIEKMDMASFPGEIEVIDKIGWDFYKAVSYLMGQKVIGFDTESRPCFAPHQHNFGVSLLQLSSGRKAYLFRIKDIGMHKALCKILSSPRIIKVGAAVADDIRGLQRYFPFSPNSFVDLQKIGWEWGIKDKSVKKMSAIILGIRISKTQQLSNWEAEVLSEAQQKYAATDAWVCREMYLKLLKTEKNPLSDEEKLPPEQRPKPQEPSTVMTGDNIRKKRHKRKKNVKNISEERS